eukprot:1161674-Pelagomonas_calceolata.AAC.4
MNAGPQKPAGVTAKPCALLYLPACAHAGMGHATYATPPRTHARARAQTQTHTYIQECMYACMHAHTYIYTHAHAHTHTHTMSGLAAGAPADPLQGLLDTLLEHAALQHAALQAPPSTQSK